MRIGIDVRIVHYARGGIGNYILRLLPAIAALDTENEYHILHSRKGRPLAPWLAPRSPGTPSGCSRE